MNLLAFSVYDEKAKAFLPPFFLHNADIAKREFGFCVNDKNHAFGKAPHDYTLFSVGAFDDNTGILLGEKNPIANGVEYVQPQMADTATQLELGT